MRRSGAELEVEAKAALESALEELGLPHRLAVDERPAGAEPWRPDFVVDVDGRLVAVEVKSVVATADARRLADLARRSGLPLLVAAERIADPAREVLRDAGVGYFDRRGRLRLVLPGIFVDAEVTGRRPHSTESAPLSGETAREVALLLLADPGARPGVREIARALDRAPSTVSAALDRLRSAGLVTSANEPLVPDLFWELESAWRRDPVPLAAAPELGRARRADPLQLGLGHGEGEGWVPDTVGWALTDTLAAVAWGLPLFVSPDYPPDFYVPSAAVLNRAVSSLGRAGRPAERACTASVAPVRLVCRRRVCLPGGTWPVASHVVVALDLAKDRARGREALERWHPEGVARVW